MSEDFSGKKAFIEIFDDANKINISFDGYVHDDFFMNNGSFLFTVNFKTDLNEDNVFETFRKWVLNTFSQNIIASAFITVESKKYSIASFFPVSVEADRIDNETNSGFCTAKIAYSIIMEN